MKWGFINIKVCINPTFITVGASPNHLCFFQKFIGDAQITNPRIQGFDQLVLGFPARVSRLFEYRLGIGNELALPCIDLIRMNIELLCQCLDTLSFLEGLQADLRLEGRRKSSRGCCLAHFLAFEDE